MKKLLLLLTITTLPIIIIIACVATSSNDNNLENIQDSTSNASVQTQDIKQNDTETTSKDELELDGRTWVGGRLITIKYNTKRRHETRADSIVFYKDLNNSIALTYDKNVAYTDSVEDVFALLNDGDLFDDLSGLIDYVFWDKYPYLIQVVSSEKVNVAGFESIKIIGTVTDDNGKEAEIYAYTFVIDNTPCMLAGVIIDAENNADVVNRVIEEVDLMAQAIKEE